MKKAVIIGAGIGGMATANLLAKAGYEVHVYEAHKTVGGRAGIMEKDGFRWDTGPSWYLMPDVFEHYYQLLDTTAKEQLKLTRLDPAYKVFFEHQPPVVIKSDIDHTVATFESIEVGAGRKLRQYVERSKHIYRLSLENFLYSNFVSLGNFIKPAVIANGLNMLQLAIRPVHSYVSRYVSDLRLQQILEYPMVFLGTSPFSAPALFSLMSALDFDEGVFYPQGGIYAIITSLQSLGDAHGVTWHTNSAVNSIMVTDGIASGIKLKNGNSVDADIVISNADLAYTEMSLLDAQWQSYPRSYWNKKQSSPSALLVYLGVKGNLKEFEHHNLFFVDEWEENFDAIKQSRLPDPASMYVCKPSQTDDTVAPVGHENLFILVPLPSGHDIEASQYPSLADHYIAQLERMAGVSIRDRIVSQHFFGPNDFSDRFHAWQNTMLGPSHLLQQSAMFRTPNISKKVSNLYYVGASTTPGIGLPMCLIGAELIYKRLINDTSSSPVKKIERIS